MNLLEQIERRIDERMKKLFGSQAPPAGGREIVEIHRAILDDVAHHVETMARGRRVFPYDRVGVTIPVPDESRRAAFQVAFVEGGVLGEAVRAVLAEDGCQVPAGLKVEAALATEPMPDFEAAGFHLRYGRSEAPGTPAETAAAALPAGSAPPCVRLTVLAGHIAERELSLTRVVINVGRLEELFDSRQRLTRRNDLAFDDSSEPPNNTVSRAHAHLRFDAAEGAFRLFDDGSSYGTSVFRDGRLSVVPPGSRGWKLNSGDEIYFGQTRVRFELSTVAG